MKNIATTGWNDTSSSSTQDVPSKAEGIVWCSAFMLEAAFIVVGNLLTIVLFAVNKKLRKKSFFLVLNMAFADLMLGIVALPFYIYFRIGPDYQLWTASVHTPLRSFFRAIQRVSIPASLIFAALISCERFYAIYWPLKHRTLTMRAYRIAIFMAWILSLFAFTLFILFSLGLTSRKLDHYILIPSYSSLLFIVCSCNIGIWRKFQHGRIAASQQQNRASQNKHLTITLLCVSIVALLSWLPRIIGSYLRITGTVRLVRFLSYSNSFFNFVMYASRIPEFRQALGQTLFRRQSVMNSEGNGRDNNRAGVLTPVTLTILSSDPRCVQLDCKEQIKDTKL